MELFDVNTRLVTPTYESPVMDLIIELEKLRTRILGGTTNPHVFFQMKEIFHTLESIGSARIEGNNTTISDYLETKYDGKNNIAIQPREGVKEIANIEHAINFIESFVKDSKIDKAFVCDLHKLVVSNLNYLNGEGDKTPGSFRLENVEIKQSQHKPIDYIRIDEFMEEFIYTIYTIYLNLLLSALRANQSIKRLNFVLSIILRQSFVCANLNSLCFI